jgi:hypothetical protein
MDFAEVERGGQADAEHLAFARRDRAPAEPRARCQDQMRGMQDDTADAELQLAVALLGAPVLNVFVEDDGGGAYRGQQRRCQLPRVERMLCKASRNAARKILHDVVGLERNGESGEPLDAVQIGAVERSAELRERMQRQGIVRVVGGEHAGSGPGGLAQGHAGLQHRHVRAAAMEFQRE